MVNTPFYKPFVLTILVCALQLLTAAQGTTSRVTGTVTDTAGAGIPGATVILTNEATRAELRTETSDDGTYVFDLVQPSTYTVSVEKTGFKKLVSTNNPVLINQPATVNAALELGDVTAVVTVENSAEQVQTSTSGNVGTTVEQKALEALPIVGLRGRNPLDLVNFQPGVTVGSNTGGGVHVHGSRDRAFNFTLDGIDINDITAGGSNFTPIRPNPDSIQEFQIVTNNPTAELGRSSGAQVTLVTRSGTNRYNGTLFEYYQTPDVNANSYQSNRLGAGRPQFVQHIYGGSFGGPVPTFGLGEGTPFTKTLRDKAFFFVNYQRLYATESVLVRRTVYTDSARRGLFRYVVGQQNAPAGTATASVNADGSPRYPNCSATITTQCIRTYDVNTGSPISFDPFVTGIINSYPLPNDYTLGDGLNLARFAFNAPQLEKQWDLTMRFDWKINEENHVYYRHAEGQQTTVGDNVNGGLRAFPDTPNIVDTTRRPKNDALNYRWSPTAKFTNEAVFGVSRFRFDFYNPGVRADVPFILNSITDAYANSLGNARKARTFQIVDNMTFDLSPHILKAGVNFRFGRVLDDRSGSDPYIEPLVTFAAGSSSFTGWNLPTAGTTSINQTDLNNLRGLANNLIGRIGSYRQLFIADPNNPSAWAPAGTRWNFYSYYPEYDFYIQDTWRARSNLVLDFGLRYELKLSPSSRDLPILRPNQDITVEGAATNTLRWEEGKLFPNDLNNFSPSVGFAWDPFKNGKTSIRANYRLSYDRFPTQVFTNSIWMATPGNTFSASDPSIPAANLLLRNGIPNFFPTQGPDVFRQPPAFSTASITLVDPKMVFPEVHQIYAGAQRELMWNNVLEVNYIHKKGRHLFGGYDSNQVTLGGRDSRCGTENFLQAFNFVKANTANNSCLINVLFTGSPTDNTGTATFRSIGAVATALSSTNSGGGVAAAAAAVSARACVAADVTAGRCTSTSQQLISRTVNNPFFFQRFPQFLGAVNVMDSNDYSNYNGLELVLKRRLSNGIGYQIGYTWSLSKDTRSFDPTFSVVSRGGVQSASSTPFDIYNRDLNYAWSDFDRRHVLVGTYVAELPLGRGRWLGGDMPKVLDWLVGGWQLAGTFRWTSGRPYTVYSGINTYSNAVQSFANCDGCTRDMGGLVQRNGTNFWFSEEEQARFSQPAPGELGNTGRNFFIGPRYFQTDASLSKNFRFTERYNLELRIDARNLTNNPSFANPVSIVNDSVFGQIGGSTANDPRRLQLSGRFNF